jgi:hypothetical protein
MDLNANITEDEEIRMAFPDYLDGEEDDPEQVHFYHVWCRLTDASQP